MISAAWKSVSKIPGELHCLVKCSFGDDTIEENVIGIGTRDIALSDGKFTGVLAQIPRTRQMWNLETHGYSIGNSGLLIDNKLLNSIKRFSDYFQEGSGNKRGLTNRKVDIRLWKEGITSFADCYQLFPNGIMGNPKHNGLNVSIPVRDRTELALADMTDPITELDAADAAGLPSDTLGKRKPMVRGDLLFRINANEENGLPASEWTKERDNNLSRLEWLGDTQWRISRDECKDLPTDSASIANGVTMWAFDPDLNDYVEVVDWTLISNDAAGAIISLDSADYYAYSAIPGLFTPGAWTNADNLLDGDITTFSQATLLNTDPVGTKVTAVFKLGLALQIQSVLAADVFIKYDHDGLSNDYELNVDGTGNYPAVGSTGDFRGSAGLAVPLAATFALNYEKVDNVGGVDDTQTVYELYLRVKYTNENILPLLFGGFGKPDGSNDLIENPAEIAEDGLRTRGGFGDDQINIPLFAQSVIDTVGFEQAFSEHNNPRIVVWLAEIARQCKSFIWRGFDDEWKMQTILDDYSDADVIEIKYDDAIKIDFKRMDPKNIVTDVDVEYNFNGEFTSRTDGATDANAREATNVTIDESHRSVQAQNIGAKTQADNYEQFFLDFWKNEHNIATVTMDLSYLEIGLGTIISFPDYPRLVEGEDITIDNVRGGQTILKEFLVYSVDTGIDNIIKAIQIPQL